MKSFDTEGFLRFLREKDIDYSLDWNDTLENLIANVIAYFLVEYDERVHFIFRLYELLPGHVSPSDIERFITEWNETEDPE